MSAEDVRRARVSLGCAFDAATPSPQFDPRSPAAGELGAAWREQSQAFALVAIADALEAIHRDLRAVSAVLEAWQQSAAWDGGLT